MLASTPWRPRRLQNQCSEGSNHPLYGTLQLIKAIPETLFTGKLFHAVTVAGAGMVVGTIIAYGFFAEDYAQFSSAVVNALDHTSKFSAAAFALNAPFGYARDNAAPAHDAELSRRAEAARELIRANSIEQ